MKVTSPKSVHRVKRNHEWPSQLRVPDRNPFVAVEFSRENFKTEFQANDAGVPQQTNDCSDKS